MDLYQEALMRDELNSWLDDFRHEDDAHYEKAPVDDLIEFLRSHGWHHKRDLVEEMMVQEDRDCDTLDCQDGKSQIPDCKYCDGAGVIRWRPATLLDLMERGKGMVEALRDYRRMFETKLMSQEVEVIDDVLLGLHAEDKPCSTA